MTEELGRGEFGVVMEASASNIPGTNGRVQIVAVKVLKSTTESSQQAFLREAERLQGINHPHVIKLLATCFVTQPMMLVFEYMRNGDVKTYLRALKDNGRTDELGEVHMLHLSLDAAAGFAYLQGQKYVHRDIAARNVLLSSSFVAKIGDFGKRVYDG